MADKEDPDELADKSVVQKLFGEVAPLYADRPGGYTRIIRLPERRIGDAGRQVLLQLVEQTPPTGGGAQAGAKAARRKRAARRAEAARKAEQSARSPAAQAKPETPSQQPDAQANRPQQAGDEPGKQTPQAQG